jgi:hypothetical protein
MGGMFTAYKFDVIDVQNERSRLADQSIQAESYVEE